MDCHLPRLELAYLIDQQVATRRTFLEVVMGCGVYGGSSSTRASIPKPNHAAAADPCIALQHHTGSIQTVPDGEHELEPTGVGWSGGQNWLRQLRGDGNTDARMRIARALGVPSGRELGRLRRVRVVLAEVEQAEERKGRWCGGSDY